MASMPVYQYCPERFEQQQFATCGVEEVKRNVKHAFPVALEVVKTVSPSWQIRTLWETDL